MPRGKVKYPQLSKEEKMKFLGDFYSMIALLGSREEVKKFFKDLLTLSETVMLARRIQIAKLLLQGKTNEEIREGLKVGYATITSVQRWLSSGFGGYIKIIERYENLNKKRSEERRKKMSETPFSFDWLRHKYPLHFLLINAVLGRKQGRKVKNQ